MILFAFDQKALKHVIFFGLFFFFLKTLLVEFE